MVYRLAELAERFSCQLAGDGDIQIDSVCTLQNGKQHAITFLANNKYRRYLESTTAAAVIVRDRDREDCPVPCLVHDNPYACYARIAQLLAGNPDTAGTGIHASATVHETASLGSDVIIGPNCYVGEHASIGDGSYLGPGVVVSAGATIGRNCRLHSNISIYHDCVIGDDALIHAGVVIGADGFGIAQDQSVWVKVPQLGRVVIGNNVEIGASTTVDRGAIEDTVIEDGVKLDNQIQIGHNVHIGAHTAIAGCVGIAGSAKIGKHCTVGGMAVVLGHLELADDVHITAQSLVTKTLAEPGVYSSGTPLQPNAEWKRNFARFRQLDDIAKRLTRIEKQVNKPDDVE